MKGPDYMIRPVQMGGLVKQVKQGLVKVHLHGRLGVITVPEKLVLCSMNVEPGVELQFYFSYLQVNTEPFDYDDSGMHGGEAVPCLLGGTILEVNDTAIRVRIMHGLGTVAVPRRWVFTDIPLEEGQNVEFYLSPMKTIGKRELPVESI